MSHIKHVLITLLLLWAGTMCSRAQDSNSSLRFEKSTWEAGTIQEAGGPVTRSFTFTNVSRKPVVIERVQNSCGCTETKFSRDPIPAGSKGAVEVTFDPRDFEGKFSRSVIIFCADGYNTLHIKGFVVPRERPVEEAFPYALSNGLRANALHQAFGYVENGTTRSMVAEVINTTDKPLYLKISRVVGIGRLKAAVPSRLAPGEKGTMTLTYDLTSEPAVYGMISDAVYISANGTESALSINANAVATDNFAGMNQENAPRAELSPLVHYFENAVRGTRPSKVFTLRNTGRSPLIVRDVAPKTDMHTDLEAGVVLKPGQAHKFEVSMDITRKADTQRGSIVIITNDPERPMREIRVVAEITK